jgi:hypothetical protein
MRCAAHAADVLEHVALRQRSHVRLAGLHTAGHEAADEDGLRAAGFGELGRNRVERAHADEGLAVE